MFPNSPPTLKSTSDSQVVGVAGTHYHGRLEKGFFLNFHIVKKMHFVNFPPNGSILVNSRMVITTRILTRIP